MFNKSLVYLGEVTKKKNTIMTDLMNINNTEKKFTSLYLTEQINLFRKQEGKKNDLRHADLLRKIEAEFKEEIDERKLSSVEYTDKKGEKRKCYEFDFEQSIQLLMSESKTVRKQVIVVLKELHSNQIPQTLSQALFLAGEQAQLIEEQKAKIQIDAPKVDFFDDLVDRSLCLNFRDTAKELNQKPMKFNSWLIEKGFLYRDKRNKLKPTALAVEKGLIVMKEFSSSDKFTSTQALTTVEGRSKFNSLLKDIKL